MPYFFTGNDYYRFNEERGRVDPGYPKRITPNWVNIPGNVDAAFGQRGKGKHPHASPMFSRCPE